MQVVIKIDDNLYERITVKKEYYLEDGEDLCSAIENGVPLPEGAEILTKEAYSDLCMRASRAESEY
jgi:hypothetical protein